MLPKEIAYDRGGRGEEIHGVKILTPGKPLKTETPYQKAKKRKPFRRCAAIEPLIGHLKEYHRMRENFLWGSASSTVNAMLAAMAWNLKKLMKEFVQALLTLIRILDDCLAGWPFISKRPIMALRDIY